jgi:hypothetical protein
VTCYNCGATTEPEQKFCEACGAKVTTEHAGGHRRTEDRAAVPGTNGGSPNGGSGNVGSGNGRWPGTQPTASPPAPSDQPAVTPVAGPPATRPVAGPGPTLPGSPIRLGDGEQVLRQYRAVQLRTRKRGEGTLYVTDARIVFYARAQGRGTQRASALFQQTRLQDVCGLQAFVSRRTSVMLIVVTAFMALFALGSLATGALPFFFVWAVLAGIGLAVIFGGGAERGRAGVKIHSLQAQEGMGFGSFENQRSRLETLLTLFIFPLLLLLRAQNAFDVLLGRPGEDTDLLIAELGALILDLQTRGELAAAYWAGLAAVPVARSGTSAVTAPSHTAG